MKIETILLITLHQATANAQKRPKVKPESFTTVISNQQNYVPENQISIAVVLTSIIVFAVLIAALILLISWQRDKKLYLIKDPFAQLQESGLLGDLVSTREEFEPKLKTVDPVSVDFVIQRFNKMSARTRHPYCFLEMVYPWITQNPRPKDTIYQMPAVISDQDFLKYVIMKELRDLKIIQETAKALSWSEEKCCAYIPKDTGQKWRNQTANTVLYTVREFPSIDIDSLI